MVDIDVVGIMAGVLLGEVEAADLARDGTMSLAVLRDFRLAQFWIPLPPRGPINLDCALDAAKPPADLLPATPGREIVLRRRTR